MRRFWQGYFAFLGFFVLLSGMLEVLSAVSGHRINCGFALFSNEAFRGIWGGMVMLFAGIFYLSGIRMFGEVHQLAKLLIGSILLWILAGTDLFALLAGALADPQSAHWFNSLDVFLKAYAPPYSPAVVLLPFSLPIMVCLRGLKTVLPTADGGDARA